MGLVLLFLVAGAAFLLGLRVGIAVGHRTARRLPESRPDPRVLRRLSSKT